MHSRRLFVAVHNPKGSHEVISVETGFLKSSDTIFVLFGEPKLLLIFPVVIFGESFVKTNERFEFSTATSAARVEFTTVPTSAVHDIWDRV